MDAAHGETGGWPLRTWVLALLGTAAGIAIHYLAKEPGTGWQGVARPGVASFIAVAAVIFGHAWTRGHAVRAALAAVAGGAVVGLVFVWNGAPSHGWSDGEAWRTAAAAISIFLFVPLVQAWWDGEGRGTQQGLLARFPYPQVHDHGWTNLLTGGLSLLFAGLFWLLLTLLGELFALIDLTFLRDGLRNAAVVAAVLGGGIGASTGLLRDRRAILSALQGVVMTVMRVAAPVLALALGLFLLALPFTGLRPLWETTRSTTPILLSVGIAALVLLNAVIADRREDEAQARVLRWSAVLLALCLTPLAVIAVVSVSQRIGQYGWTPARLWADVFVNMALVVGLAYLLALVRRRGDWAAGLRRANLIVAFILCGVALLLSTPLVSFDAIATSDQMARLADGRLSPAKLDYRAFRFDFGAPGEAALRDLAKTGKTAEVRRYASAALALKNRWDPDPAEVTRQADSLDTRITILPQKAALDPKLRKRLLDYELCGSAGQHCLIVYRPGEDHAVITIVPSDRCKACTPIVRLLYRGQGDWDSSGTTASVQPAMVAAVRAGRVEMRRVERRQLFIDGQPFGDPIPLDNSKP